MSKAMDRLRSSLGGNIRESMGGTSTGGAGGPLPGVSHSVTARYDGLGRPKDVVTIPVDRLSPDPDQPRKDFDEDELTRLTESLKTRGQLQPIRVRFDEGRGAWLIVSGERRWRAATLAGLSTLAAVEVKGVIDPDTLLEDQIVENCLRTDLRPIEQAHAFRALMDRRGYSQRQLAESLAVSHMAVGRALALLELPEAVQEQVEHGVIPASVAYEVAKLDTPEIQAEVAQAVVREGLKRDEVTELVSAIRAKRPTPAAKPEPVTIDVGDGTSVKVTWRKANSLDVIKALRIALKQMQAHSPKDEAA